VLFVPQAMRMRINRDAKNVSFITFFGFWLIQLVTTLHGFLHRDYLLAYGTLVSMVTCGYVIWLIIYYKLKNKRI
jgi:cytosine/uracil/thiamine/allantoin permease